MKTKLAFFLGVFAALTFTAFRGLAVELPRISEANLAGLQVSLTTSGYKFLLGDGETTAATVEKPAREWFVASALLANRSNTDITFTFPTPVAAQAKWTFRIFDSKGVQLWRSDEGVFSAQVLTEDTLNKRGRWKRLIQVPLRIHDKWLAPGLYTLEASIDSDKTLGATVQFEIVLSPLLPGNPK